MAKGFLETIVANSTKTPKQQAKIIAKMLRESGHTVEVHATKNGYKVNATKETTVVKKKTTAKKK